MRPEISREDVLPIDLDEDLDPSLSNRPQASQIFRSNPQRELFIGSQPPDIALIRIEGFCKALQHT